MLPQLSGGSVPDITKPLAKLCQGFCYGTVALYRCVPIRLVRSRRGNSPPPQPVWCRVQPRDDSNRKNGITREQMAVMPDNALPAGMSAIE